MIGGGGTEKVPSLPPPKPKSPPQYPDLYGKRRELARVQLMERDIGYLEDELKFVEGFQPASRSCKEVADFVVANSDPFIPTTKRAHKSCGFWKWLCGGSSCFSFSWICCRGCCKGCPSCCCCNSNSCNSNTHLEMPKCCKSECSTCQCQCQCKCKCSSCFRCSRPKCSSCCCRGCCCSGCCACPDLKCCCKMPSCSSLTCCIPKCPSCSCSDDCCHCKCCGCISCYPKCLKINLCSCSCTKNCCTKNCCSCSSCYRCCYIC